MKLKLYITNMETDQIVKFVGYDHYYNEVMSKTSFWNYMSGCTVVGTISISPYTTVLTHY